MYIYETGANDQFARIDCFLRTGEGQVADLGYYSVTDP